MCVYIHVQKIIRVPPWFTIFTLCYPYCANWQIEEPSPKTGCLQHPHPSDMSSTEQCNRSVNHVPAPLHGVCRPCFVAVLHCSRYGISCMRLPTAMLADTVSGIPERASSCWLFFSMYICRISLQALLRALTPDSQKQLCAFVPWLASPIANTPQTTPSAAAHCRGNSDDVHTLLCPASMPEAALYSGDISPPVCCHVSGGLGYTAMQLDHMYMLLQRHLHVCATFQRTFWPPAIFIASAAAGVELC